MMEYLFDSLEEIEKLINSKEKVLLFLDYDGTITPIVELPELAVLSPETRELLHGISRSLRYAVCIISGRPIADVRKLAGLEGVTT